MGIGFPDEDLYFSMVSRLEPKLRGADGRVYVELSVDTSFCQQNFQNAVIRRVYKVKTCDGRTDRHRNTYEQ